VKTELDTLLIARYAPVMRSLIAYDH